MFRCILPKRDFSEFNCGQMYERGDSWYFGLPSLHCAEKSMECKLVNVNLVNLLYENHLVHFDSLE